VTATGLNVGRALGKTVANLRGQGARVYVLQEVVVGEDRMYYDIERPVDKIVR
jgi:hypothetical protein